MLVADGGVGRTSMKAIGRGMLGPRAGRPSTTPVAVAIITVLSLLAGVLGGQGNASAQVDDDPVPPEAAVVLDGASSATAAASCWEIKQLVPDAVDGVYWLRTETLVRPEQFYCDMTTDGGGWVLIGRGREGWTFRDYGQMTIADVRDPVTGPGAFSPAALDTAVIDGLLDGQDVQDLVDGVRLRRALDKAGNDWQEVRWQFLDLAGWSWAFGGGHRLSAWSVGELSGTGSNTKASATQMPGEVGDGNDGNFELAWFTFPWSGHGFTAGFSYRGTVDGENDGSSYLWELNTEDHAIPFTQVFIRPRLTTPVLTPVPDTGTPEATLSPLLDDRPLEIAGGVTGVRKAGDTEPATDTPVQAFATLGDRVYVGGKFDNVRDTTTGNLVDQNYLAAFDRDTGAWISTFRPTLDGTVWDLAVADGRLIVAGQFTDVDGEPLTAGLAALDPVTGAVDSNWTASLTLSGSSSRPFVRGLDVDGDWIYVGGNFTSITHRRSDGSELVRNTGRLARVGVADGFPDNEFLPNLDGVAYDIDADGDRVHIVGVFDGVNRASNANDRLADPINNDTGYSVLDATSGTVVPGLAPVQYTTSATSRWYQQTVVAVGSEVYIGGSEHSVHSYARTDNGLLRSWITSGNGGDSQAFAVIDGVVYQGSHGNSWIYDDAVTWPQLDGYTRVDDYKWLGAFDIGSRSYLREWVPSLRTQFTEGAWALHADQDDCLWFGGDFSGGPFVNGQRQYLEGFSKFCQRDTQAPSVPLEAAATDLGVDGVRVSWPDSVDDRPGFIGYEVLRNDRVISPLVYGRSYTDSTGTATDRYFVRAVDPAGNRSASSAVLLPGDNTAPSTPQNLAAVLNADGSVDLVWDAAIDDSVVERYDVYRNGEFLLEVPGDATAVTIEGLEAGTHFLQIEAVDDAGNSSARSPSVRVDIDGPDTQRPSQPGSPDAVVNVDGTISFSWLASSDDVGVTGYRVRRNLVEVVVVGPEVLSVDVDLGVGTHFLQVEAFDAAGNVSYRTSPVRVEVTDPGDGGDGPDTQRPSQPGSPDAVVNVDGTISFSWLASSDDVGVTGYRVRRNLVEVVVVGPEVLSVDVDLGVGTHFLQVEAFDAAGNVSYRTSPVRVEVTDPGDGGDGPDTQRPSYPTNVEASVGPGGIITVTWTGSTDDVGVVSYRVLRNLVQVDLVPDPTTTTDLDLGPGTHYLQIEALDAAGNGSGRTAPVMVTV